MRNTETEKPLLLRGAPIAVMSTYVVIAILLWLHRLVFLLITEISRLLGFDIVIVTAGDDNALANIRATALNAKEYILIYHVALCIIIAMNIAFIAIQLYFMRYLGRECEEALQKSSGRRIMMFSIMLVLIIESVMLMYDPTELRHLTGMSLLLSNHPYGFLFFVLFIIHSTFWFAVIMVTTVVYAVRYRTNKHQ